MPFCWKVKSPLFPRVLESFMIIRVPAMVYGEHQACRTVSFTNRRGNGLKIACDQHLHTRERKPQGRRGGAGHEPAWRGSLRVIRTRAETWETLETVCISALQQRSCKVALNRVCTRVLFNQEGPLEVGVEAGVLQFQGASLLRLKTT